MQLYSLKNNLHGYKFEELKLVRSKARNSKRQKNGETKSVLNEL